jgi:hypothetical protein
VEVSLQKNAGSKFSAAFHMLKDALPEDFSIGTRSDDRHPWAFEIRAPSLEPLEGVLVASPDAPGSKRGVCIVVLDGGSEREHDNLRRAGVSFVDLSGVVHLRAPGIFVDRTGLTPMELYASPSTRVDPYADRASQVVRVLLMSPRARRWSTSGLAVAADVDVSVASRVVRELRRRQLVLDEAPGQGRSSRIGVADPMALLADWTRRYSWDDNRLLRLAAPVGSVTRFLSRMGDLFTGRRWALSLQAGASLVAPYAEFDVVHVYVDASAEGVALDRRWESSPSGKVILMESAYVNSVWFQQQRFDKLSVVSPIQLVLDLWHYPVRGREQADHIVETVLRPLWDQDAGL